MYIEKLSIQCFDDFPATESVQVSSFTSGGGLGVDSEKVEAVVEAIAGLYEHDPVRIVVTYETSNG